MTFCVNLCLSLRFIKQYLFVSLNLCTCIQRIHFVSFCEITLSQVPSCSSDWSFNENICYFVNPEQSYSYEQADEDCRSKDAQLVSIHSGEDQAYITGESVQIFRKYILMLDL